jgi:hypothetical protein
MKRIKILALCLTAVFVLGVAAVASASPPEEIGVCVKQKRGVYTEANCETDAAKAHKGTFEFHEWGECYATKGGNFTESLCKTVAMRRGKPDHKGGFELAAAPPPPPPPPPFEASTNGTAAFPKPAPNPVLCKFKAVLEKCFILVKNNEKNGGQSFKFLAQRILKRPEAFTRLEPGVVKGGFSECETGLFIINTLLAPEGPAGEPGETCYVEIQLTKAGAFFGEYEAEAEARPAKVPTKARIFLQTP